jgi:tRNA-specific 2-thiouridylase
MAMSGGVDSSVGAYLLKEAGYEVVGITMRLWTVERPEMPPHHRRCCSVEDVEDARRVCQVIGVPHYVFNLEREFKARVVDYFCQEYRRGRTPHPCIACNDKIKFDALMRRAQALDAEYVATGHYARISNEDGYYNLHKALDPAKDQSYVLYNLNQEQLGHILFPVGALPKPEVRRMAELLSLPVADKPDSQEICFIPQGDYREFLAKRITSTPGDIVDTNGRVLGRHSGIEFFTVGQRHGLGIPGPDRYYVKAIDPERNRVIAGAGEELFDDCLLASGVNYISGRPPDGVVPVAAKIRYKAREAESILYPRGQEAELRFKEPQRAITPGQAVVFYQGDEVLGGGVIEKAWSSGALPSFDHALDTSGCNMDIKDVNASDIGAEEPIR